MSAQEQELHLHLSTLGALEAMRSLKEDGAEFFNIADIGCGGGALAMQAAVFWPHARIIASDISERATSDAASHIAHAGLIERIQVVRADGYQHPQIRQSAPFDLVLCNLLAIKLVEFARDLEESLAEGAIAVLSGILPWFREDVMRAHAALKLLPLGHLEVEQWHTILLKKIGK